MSVVVRAALLYFAACASTQANEPVLELGIGFGGVSLPDYRGADEQSSYVVPWPFIVYEHEQFSLDRQGLRGRLFGRPDLSVLLSVNAGVPVNSDENSARAGMPDLDPSIEIGPELDWRWRRVGAQRLGFKFPVRAVFATDLSYADAIGWVAHPQIAWARIPRTRGDWDIDAIAGPLFAGDRYHDYYYAVAPAFATALRPTYDSRAGYSGFRSSIGGSRRFGRYWLGGYVRYEYLRGAAFDDSPLYKRDHALMLGLGFAYLFKTADRPVPQEP